MKFGAVITAAGLSSRMGAFKPLLPLGGTTIIERIIRTLRAGGVEDIAVVTGHNARLIEDTLRTQGIIFVHNKDFAVTDMFYSASIGLEAIASSVDAIFFTPVDTPLFAVDTVSFLTKAMQNTGSHIVIPSYNGKRGHPLVLLSQTVKELIHWKGAGGIRGAIDAYSGSKAILETEDSGILLEADTPEEYHVLMLASQQVKKS